MKSIIDEFVESSKKLDLRVSHSASRKIEFIIDNLKEMGGADKYYYFDIYNIELSSIPSTLSLMGIGFYEFNINGFSYIIMRKDNEFYILNYRDGYVRLTNRYYKYGVGRNKIANFKVFEGEHIGQAGLMVIDEVDSVSDNMYVNSILSILHDMANDNDFVFTYLENTYIEANYDLLSPHIGGKTGLFIPTKLIYSDFTGNMARYGFIT